MNFNFVSPGRALAVACVALGTMPTWAAVAIALLVVAVEVWKSLLETATSAERERAITERERVVTERLRRELPPLPPGDAPLRAINSKRDP